MNILFFSPPPIAYQRPSNARNQENAPLDNATAPRGTVPPPLRNPDLDACTYFWKVMYIVNNETRVYTQSSHKKYYLLFSVVFLYCVAGMWLYQSPRITDFRYYQSSAGCGYVCVGVLPIVATPFNLELWNFGITFLMCIILAGFFFSNFWKKNQS